MRVQDLNTWIGLLEVRPKSNNDILGGAPGAYTNVVCLANDVPDYSRKVKHALGALGLEVIWEDRVEPLDHRLVNHDISDELRECVNNLSEECPVLFDAFYVFESE